MSRQTKLVALIESMFGGNQAAFSAAIKRSPAQVNQWVSGHRQLGDAGARIIELALNLQQGYFDDATQAAKGTADDGSIGEVVSIMRGMCNEHRLQLLAFAKGIAAKAPTVKK